jgi:hypothetical protein
MTRRIILIAAFALATTAIHAAEKPPKMETRLYRITTLMLCPKIERPAVTNDDGTIIEGKDMKSGLMDLGVGFPTGSTITYDTKLNGFIVRNTVENQILLRGLFAQLDGEYLKNVELDFSVITFPPADIEAVARKSKTAAPLQSDIIELWKSGKGKLEASQKLSTRSGVNAQMQAVDEIIYPTQLDDPLQNGNTNALFDKHGVESMVEPCVIFPSAFETRECGFIVNFTPTVVPDGKAIDLVISPEFTDPTIFDDITVIHGSTNSPQQVKIQQPRFHTNKITTTITIRDGETHVTGGMANRANDGWRYFFITARIVDASGGKPGEADDSILLDDGSATPAK